MKKHYFLVLMASVACGMSAQAQIQAPPQAAKQTVPMTRIQQPIQSNLKANIPSGLLRAADVQMLPDSIYNSNGIGEYNKTYLKYTDDGWISEQLSYNLAYGGDGSTFYTRYSAKYGHDEHGSLTFSIVDDEFFGTETTTTYENTYDEQGRLSSVYSIAEEINTYLDETNTHSITNYEYDGNNYVVTKCDTVFSEDGSYYVSRSKNEYHFDDAGNQTAYISYGYLDYDEEGNPDWFQQNINEYTYDARNFQIGSHSVSYDASGNMTYESVVETAYLDDNGRSYITINQYKYWQGDEDWLEAEDRYKYEYKGENPVIIYYSLPDGNGGWLEPQIQSISFYPGPFTANETIKDSADPAFEVRAANGAIVITTTEAQAVQIYGMTGVCHYNATVNGTATITNLPAGIYVVTAGGEALKVSVR